MMETESGPASAVTAPSQTAALSQEDEDSELKDLVTQTLQSAGILGKIKAELRSSVYLALENTRKGDGKRDTKGSRLRKARIGQGSERLSRFLQSSEGRLALNLVKEFLSFFDLSFTSSVLEPESDITPLVGEEGDKRRRYPPAHRSRQDLIELLGLAPEMIDNKTPLISQIIRLSKVSVLKSETPSPTDFVEDSRRTDIDSFLIPSSLHPADDGPAGVGGGGRHEGGSGNTPTLQSLTTPESSLNPAAASAFQHSATSNMERLGATNSRPEPQAPPKNLEVSHGDQTEKKPSFLSDLPPLGSSSKGSSLPPLKKSGSKDGGSLDLLDEILSKQGAGTEQTKSKKDCNILSRGSSLDKATRSDDVLKDRTTLDKAKDARFDMHSTGADEIDEELEFSEDISISAASEGFTKDESLINEAQFKADYIENLDK